MTRSVPLLDSLTGFYVSLSHRLFPVLFIKFDTTKIKEFVMKIHKTLKKKGLERAINETQNSYEVKEVE